jgi:hypothetical protein
MAKPLIKTKVLKQVTLPVFKLIKNQPLYIQIKTPMHVGKKIDDKREPATLIEAVNCDGGELGHVVCPTIMQKELRANYEGDAYVGKFFEIVTHVLPGKEYTGVTITEIADPTDDLSAAREAQRKEAEAKAKASDDASDAGPAGEPAKTDAAAAPKGGKAK